MNARHLMILATIAALPPLSAEAVDIDKGISCSTIFQLSKKAEEERNRNFQKWMVRVETPEPSSNEIMIKIVTDKGRVVKRDTLELISADEGPYSKNIYRSMRFEAHIYATNHTGSMEVKLYLRKGEGSERQLGDEADDNSADIVMNPRSPDFYLQAIGCAWD